jgi:hypothetical protein
MAMTLNVISDAQNDKKYYQTSLYQQKAIFTLNNF